MAKIYIPFCNSTEAMKFLGVTAYNLRATVFYYSTFDTETTTVTWIYTVCWPWGTWSRESVETKDFSPEGIKQILKERVSAGLLANIAPKTKSTFKESELI